MSCSKCTDAAVYKCKACNSIFCIPDWDAGHVCNVRLEGRNDQPLIAMVYQFETIDATLVGQVANILSSKLENYRIEIFDSDRLPSNFSPNVVLIPEKMIGARPSISQNDSMLLERMRNYTNNVMILLLELNVGSRQARNEFVFDNFEYGGFGLGTPDATPFSPRFFINKGELVNLPQNDYNLNKLKNNLERYAKSSSTVYEQPRQTSMVPQKQPEKMLPAMQMHEQQIAALKQENEMHRKKIAELKAKSKAQKARITALETNVRQSGGSIAQEKLVLQQKEEQIRELSQNLAQVTAARKRLQEKLVSIIKLASSE